MRSLSPIAAPALPQKQYGLLLHMYGRYEYGPSKSYKVSVLKGMMKTLGWEWTPAAHAQQFRYRKDGQTISLGWNGAGKTIKHEALHDFSRHFMAIYGADVSGFTPKEVRNKNFLAPAP